MRNATSNLPSKAKARSIYEMEFTRGRKALYAMTGDDVEFRRRLGTEISKVADGAFTGTRSRNESGLRVREYRATNGDVFFVFSDFSAKKFIREIGETAAGDERLSR